MLFLKNILRTILYKPLFNALIFLVWLIPGHNVAWAIISLTIVIRVILLPSTLSAARAQKKMKDLQPEIQALQDQYKNDKQKQAQVMMEFYKKNKINPVGSCLPLLIQLPILIVLYYVFLHGLNANYFGNLYGFVPRPETINTVFLGIDLSQKDRFILPVIAGILQFVQTWQITPKTKPQKGGEMQQMISKQMLYLMPVFTIFIAGSLPAALPLYWIVTSAFTVVQQYLVFRQKPGETKKEQSVVNIIDDKIKTIKKGGLAVTVRRKGDK